MNKEIMKYIKVNRKTSLHFIDHYTTTNLKMKHDNKKGFFQDNLIKIQGFELLTFI